MFLYITANTVRTCPAWQSGYRRIAACAMCWAGPTSVWIVSRKEYWSFLGQIGDDCYADVRVAPGSQWPRRRFGSPYLPESPRPGVASVAKMSLALPVRAAMRIPYCFLPPRRYGRSFLGAARLTASPDPAQPARLEAEGWPRYLYFNDVVHELWSTSVAFRKDARNY